MLSEKSPQNEKTDKSALADLSDSCFSKSLVSSTDCTGLIPALPESDAELEAYEEMYQFCYMDKDDTSFLH